MKFTIVLTILVAVVHAAPLIKSIGTPIPDSYVVILKEGTSVEGIVPKFNEIARRQNSRGGKLPTITRKYNQVSGFAVTANNAALEELLALAEVEYVEQDSIIEALAIQYNPPSWGLIRVAQQVRDLTVGIYPFPDVAGDGINAFVLDTGIYFGHNDFNGRAVPGFNAFPGTPDEDQNGHGTHVAGVIGGKLFGVAKKVKLISVKVLNAQGSGTTSGVIAGMDWVRANAPIGRSVVNMSLGGRQSSAIDAAAQRLFNDNIPLIAAGGNSATSACNTSPAGAPNVFAVAATNDFDQVLASGSLGPCIDAFAPGFQITSAWIGNPDASLKLTGSSIAAAHVSGALALYLSQTPILTAQGAFNKLIATATPNVVVGNLQGAPNRLVYTLG
ncbi:hypothetical protein DFQ27_006401 [Actinomortierella ambigua]|uniref:Uncharacterized protein n=1 Tax=Actinomortierella ambigua TaxID=1343610 RepID=A0A9P6PYI5_9FUNG|nr:hypothetical protein DFQ27_006401 [Actinomortierella ambigua]